MKTINTIKRVFYTAALFALFTMTLSCESGVGLFGGNDGFTITVASAAVGNVAAGQERGLKGDIVNVYARNGITPQIIRAGVSETGDWYIQATPGAQVADEDLLARIGMSQARLWTFVMPECDVGINITDNFVDAEDIFIKVIRITAAASANGSELVYQNGAVVPTQIEAKAPPGRALTVKVTLASGVTAKYGTGSIGASAENPLTADGSFTIDAIGTDSVCEFLIEATKGEQTNIYPFLLYTSENRPASTNADLAKLTITGFDKIRDIYASPVVDLFDSTTNTASLTASDAALSEVILTPVAANGRALMKINDGAIVSGGTRLMGLNKRGSDVNVITIEVTAEAGNSKTYTVNISRPLSAENRLASLTVNVIGDYGFKPGEINVAQDTYDLNTRLISGGMAGVVPTLKDGAAKLYMDNSKIDGGVMQIVALDAETGSREIKFKVVPEDPSAQEKTYVLKLYHDASGGGVDEASPKITDIEFSQGDYAGPYVPIVTNFTPTQKNYAFETQPVPSDMKKIKVTVTAEIPVIGGEPVTATFYIGSDDPSVPSDDGKMSAEVSLPNYGGAANEIIVRAKGSSSTSVYVLKVYRSASSDAHLDSLTVSGLSWTFADTEGNGDAVFDLSDPAYIVDNNVSSVQITPTARYPLAGIKVNSGSRESGKPFGYTFSGFGSYKHDIEITVTAEDGITVKKYKLTLYRSADGDTALTNLVTSNEWLDPVDIVFSAGNTSYNLNSDESPVDYFHDTIKVTATLNSPTSYIKMTDASGDSFVASGYGYTWVLSGDGSMDVTESTLIVTVVAQNGTENSYTLKVWRKGRSSDNTELLRIMVTVKNGAERKTNFNARVYPPVSLRGDDDAYKLYAPSFAGREFTVSGITLDPKAKCTTYPPNSVEYSSPGPFNEAALPYWDEVPLDPAITLTVESSDRSQTRVYTIKKIVFTPGKEWDRVPTAKGGEITFINGIGSAKDELHSFPPGQTGTLEFLSYLPGTGRLLVEGGAGAGGRHDDTELGAGGGGGGGGGVIVRDKYTFANRSYAVSVGTGGTANGSKREPDGTFSKFGSTLYANGGTGGWKAAENKDDEWCIAGDPVSSNSFVWLDPSYHEYPGSGGSTEGGSGSGGSGGDHRRMVNFAVAMAQVPASAAGIAVMMAVIPVVTAYTSDKGQYHLGKISALEWYAKLLVYIAALVMILLPHSWSWIEYSVGGAGGGGASGGGAAGEHERTTPAQSGDAEGGSGGAGVFSDIAGSRAEYGAGGAGGDSLDDGGKDGFGGNGSSDANGGDGKVITRWVWDEIYR